jgi:hypothetical protein
MAALTSEMVGVVATAGLQIGNAYSFAGATITAASPCVVTAAGNQYQNGWRVFFSGGSLVTKSGYPRLR